LLWGNVVISLAMRRLMLIAVVAAVALGLSACTIWKEPRVATWKNTTSVEAMERLLWQEIQAGNWVEVEARLASNFTASTAEGVLDKQQMIARWKSWPRAQAALGEFAVTDNGETTVVTYNYASGAGVAGRRLSVWQKQKDGYVLIAHAEGGAAPQTPKM